MADGGSDFASLLPLERSKLMTYGNGEAPYPGYVWNWDDVEPRWRPGEGVEDVNAGRHTSFQLSPARVIQLPADTEQLIKSQVFLTLNTSNEIVGAYWNEARAQRDVELVSRASGHVLTIKPMDIET